VILAGSGLSSAARASEAAREAALRALATLGGRPPTWGLVYATPFFTDGFEEILGEVVGLLGTDRISGCSGLGVLTEAGEIEAAPGVAVLAVCSDGLEAEPFLAGANEASRVLAGDPADLIFLTPDPGALAEAASEGLLEGGLLAPTLVGATAAAVGESTAQFRGAEVAAGVLGGLRLGGAFFASIGLTQGCTPLGGPLRVTGGRSQILSHLDGAPALAALSGRLPEVPADELDRLVSSLFLAVAATSDPQALEKGEYLVRPILGLDPESGALGVAFDVEEGMAVLPVVRDAEPARADLRSMLARTVGRVSGRERFAVYFNCCARGTSLYGDPGVDAAAIAEALPGVPLIGLFGNGEIAPIGDGSRLFAYTGVLTVISER
jgi:small ligand-binding sensory domain FIST